MFSQGLSVWAYPMGRHGPNQWCRSFLVTPRCPRCDGDVTRPSSTTSSSPCSGTSTWTATVIWRHHGAAVGGEFSGGSLKLGFRDPVAVWVWWFGHMKYYIVLLLSYPRVIFMAIENGHGNRGFTWIYPLIAWWIFPVRKLLAITTHQNPIKPYKTTIFLGFSYCFRQESAGKSQFRTPTPQPWAQSDELAALLENCGITALDQVWMQAFSLVIDQNNRKTIGKP